MTHNSTQELCSGDEPDFAFGEVYGLRQWSVSRPPLSAEVQDPKLVGHFSKTWTLGTNYAQCFAAQGGHTTIAISPEDFRGLYEIGHNPIDAALDKVQKRLAGFRIEDLASLEIDGGEDGGRYHSRTMSWTSSMVTANRSFRHAPIVQRTPGRVVYAGDRFKPRIRLDRIESDGSRVYVDLDSGSSLVYYNVEQYTAMRTSLDSAAPIIYNVSWKLDEACGNIAQPKCICGFYAYTNIESIISNSYNQTASVFGLIRGHGKVTIGTKGFRAEKADIVALAAPVHFKAQSLSLSAFSASSKPGAKLVWEPASKGVVSLRELEHYTRKTNIAIFENPDQLLEFSRVHYGLSEI